MSGRGLRADVFPARRGKGHWAVPGLLLLAVVLVAALAYNLANLDTGGEAIPDLPDAGGAPIGGFVPSDPGATLLLFTILGLLFGVVIYALLRMRNRDQEVREPRWSEVLAQLVGLVYIVALLVAWPHLIRLFNAIVNTPRSPGVGDGDGTGTGVVLSTVSGISAGAFLFGSVLVAILIVAFLARRGRDFRQEIVDMPFEGFGIRREAAYAVDRTIRELEFGADVRGAILACFQQFCFLLAGKGITDQTARTPRELSVLAVERLGASTDAADALTSLFEVARYSEHPLGKADRESALRSLDRIRSALEA